MQRQRVITIRTVRRETMSGGHREPAPVSSYTHLYSSSKVEASNSRLASAIEHMTPRQHVVADIRPGSGGSILENMDVERIYR
jgi:hypothetical protein